MLGSPPVDPRIGNARQKAVLAKLMEQFERQGRRRGVLGRLGAGAPGGLTGRLTKFNRRGAVPRITRPFIPGREFGLSAAARNGGLGAQGTPGEYESSLNPGEEARAYPSLLPVPFESAEDYSAPSTAFGGSQSYDQLGSSGVAPAGDPYAPARTDAQTNYQQFQENTAVNPSPTGMHFDLPGAGDKWIPIGNGLYFNSETQIIRGSGMPAKFNGNLLG